MVPILVDVGSIDDFVEAVPRVVAVDGREIGIVVWQREVFALRNICPHQLGPICGGYVMRKIVSDASHAVDVQNDNPVVICPWHGWEFEVRTGRAAWGDPSYKLRTYPAAVVDGRVLVDASPRRAEAVVGVIED
jgi:nitrite reductase (NADH) small subunit